MQEYLDMDGAIAFNLAIYNRFSSIGDNTYAEVCGGFIEGVYQWTTHNIDNVMSCQNDKYHGWTIEFASGQTRRVYVPNWVMASKPNNWKHAKNLFNKNLMEDVKFNNEQRLLNI